MYQRGFEAVSVQDVCELAVLRRAASTLVPVQSRPVVPMLDLDRMRSYFDGAISDAVLSGDIGPTDPAQASVACWSAWRAWYCGGQGGERPPT